MFERITPKVMGSGLALLLLVAAVISFLPGRETRTAVAALLPHGRDLSRAPSCG